MNPLWIKVLVYFILLSGTLYSPTDGTIDPTGICTATTRAAKKAGAKVSKTAKGASYRNLIYKYQETIKTEAFVSHVDYYYKI